MAANTAAVITGGGSGIGRASAVAFAEAGFDIAVVGRRPEPLTATAAAVEAMGRRCLTIVADLARDGAAENAIASAYGTFGRIDALLNNAGNSVRAPIEKFTIQEFDSVMAVNVRAIFAACKAVWPIMKQQGGGTIINISSMAAKDPFPEFAVYAASKAAVNLLSTGLAGEGRPHNIRVFSLAPGAVETAMLRAVAPDFPAELCMQPGDVAQMAVLLADPRFRHASGEHIHLQKA